MNISFYSFGRIRIDNKTFHHDIIINPDGSVLQWQRRQGHLLQNCDLEELLKQRPDLIIVGTGFWGAMKVSEEVEETLDSSDIEVYYLKSAAAVDLFNNTSSTRKTALAIHLTC